MVPIRYGTLLSKVPSQLWLTVRPVNRRLKKIVLVLFNKFSLWNLSLTQNRRKCAEQLGIVPNKVSRGFVAHAWRCAQTNCSAPKWYELFSHFTNSCVLGLCRDHVPRPKIVERRVVGGGIQDSGSMKPRIRTAHLLITHVLNSCAKLLVVLHISSTQGQSVPHLYRVFIERGAYTRQ